MRRFKKTNPCPVCGGWDSLKRGVGLRCFGFISKDGAFAHCSRPELSGNLNFNEKSQTYPHLLAGLCKCGKRHVRAVRVVGREIRATGDRTLVRRYRYEDANGKVLSEILRYNPKAFRQRQPDGEGGWLWNLDGVESVPYRLPEILAADPKQWVYVAEGEKDADALVAQGFLATTNPGGAGKWQASYSKVLRHRKVAILPDNDEAGITHAEQVAESLGGIAKRIKIVTLPGLPTHGDVSDWLESSGTPGGLKALVRNAPLYAPISKGSGLPFHTAAEMRAKKSKPVKWIVPGFVASGSMTDVIGKVKTAGKTTLLTHMAAAVVTGRDFLGLETTRCPVVYLTEQPWTSFREALRRAGLLSCSDFVFLLWPDAIREPWDKVAAAAVTECQKRGAGLIVVDTVAPFAGLAGATENDSGHALAALKPLQAATSAGIAVVIVQHERKGGGELVESGRGSTAFAGAVDILFSLRRRQGQGQRAYRELHAESRFDETPSSLLIELTDAGFVSHGEVRPIADEQARESILEALPKSEEKAVTLVQLIAECAISRTTGQKAVMALLTQGLLQQAGKGKRKNPFRYWAADAASDVAE